MEITEEQVYSALGLDPAAQADSAGAGDSTPQQAENAAAQETSNTPTVDNDAAADAQADSNTGADEGEPTNPEPEDGKGTQNADERHANAARRREAEETRRKQEQQTAIDQAVQRALEQERGKSKQQVEDIFKKAGLVNSYTKEPIKTAEDFEAWSRQHEDRKMQQAMKNGTMTADQFNEMIERNPTVAAMKEAAETQRQAARQAQEREAQARINAELAEINKLDPSIKTVKDLTTMQNSKQFYNMVQRGATFLEAFKATSFDSMRSNTIESARQQAGMNARGKDHLNSTPSARGTGAITVPRAELQMFRAFNPKATDAEIQAYYNKHLNG